jgi:hypothetical protein
MSEIDLGILPACRFVTENASHVRLDETRLHALADEWVREPFAVPAWDDEIHWRGSEADTAGYILLLDALNFCFWADPGQPRWRVEHRGKVWNGYKALSVALARALDDGVPLVSPEYLAGLEMSQLTHILRGEGEIPMLHERLRHAREVGSQLLALYDGDVRNLLRRAEGSARELTRRIAEDFPCFHDVSLYRGRSIPLYKRAQITVVDLAGSLGFAGLGAFADLHELTAFADYKIPQVLRALGVMVYSSELERRVDAQELLAPGCEEEVEIRAVMVWAVERLRLALQAGGRSLRAFEVDWFLWNVGQQPLPDERPYHRTRTVYY